MTTIKPNIPHDLAEEYRMAASENAEMMKDFAHTNMEGWGQILNAASIRCKNRIFGKAK